MIATIDTGALFKLVWAAPLAVFTITISYALAVNGVARAAEASRDGRATAAAAYGVLAIVGGGIFVAAVVFGLIIMVSKR